LKCFVENLFPPTQIQKDFSQLIPKRFLRAQKVCLRKKSFFEDGLNLADRASFEQLTIHPTFAPTHSLPPLPFIHAMSFPAAEVSAPQQSDNDVVQQEHKKRKAMDATSSLTARRKVVFIYRMDEGTSSSLAYVIEADKLDTIGGIKFVRQQLALRDDRKRQMYIEGKKCTFTEFKKYKGEGDAGDVFAGFIAWHKRREIQDDFDGLGFEPSEEEELVWAVPYYPCE
jgi:hypothetical protein